MVLLQNVAVLRYVKKIIFKKITSFAEIDQSELG
jgi:hypothetical protein